MAEPSPGAGRAGATLLLVATFALGMIAGGALLHIARLSLGGGPPPPGPPPLGGPREPPSPLVHLADELDLSAEQIERVRDILDESRNRMHDEAEATRARIRELLTPEQSERFDSMRRPPFPPGGPGPGRPHGSRPPRRP